MGELVTSDGILYVSLYPPFIASDSSITIAMPAASGNQKVTIIACGADELILIKNVSIEIASTLAAERAWVSVTVDRGVFTSTRLAFVYSRQGSQRTYNAMVHCELQNGDHLSVEYNNSDTGIINTAVHILGNKYRL